MNISELPHPVQPGERTISRHMSGVFTHTVTVFHAEVQVYTPAPEGGSYVQSYRCTHDHKTEKGAQECQIYIENQINKHKPLPHFVIGG